MRNKKTTSCEDCCRAFAESYHVSSLPAMLEIERAVLGCSYGGTSWTTNRQAERAIEVLALRRGRRLLDVGSGSGWPGLFVADRSGCEVTLVDLPLNALATAVGRARHDGTGGRCWVVAGSGIEMPIGSSSHYAISHSDVLCCLPEKSEMLRECRRAVRDGGSMLLSVLDLAPHLSDAERGRAIEAGPPFVEAPNSYADLLAETGWRLEERWDLTADWRCSLRALVEGIENSTDLAEALGAEEIAAEIAHRREQVAVIDSGLLVREAYLATAS